MIRYIVLTTGRKIHSRHLTLTGAYRSETRAQAAGHGTWIEAVSPLGLETVGETVGERIILSDREHAAHEDCRRRRQRQNAWRSVAWARAYAALNRSAAVPQECPPLDAIVALEKEVAVAHRTLRAILDLLQGGGAAK